MTTFVLSKYKDEKPSNDNVTETEEVTKEEDVKLTIEVTGSIAEVIATAINKVFSKKIEITETEDSGVEADTKVITTEDINENPIDCLSMVKPNNTLYVRTETAFSTAKEEWFLLNANDRTSNIVYSNEAFFKHIEQRLGVTRHEG